MVRVKLNLESFFFCIPIKLSLIVGSLMAGVSPGALGPKTLIDINFASEKSVLYPYHCKRVRHSSVDLQWPMLINDASPGVLQYTTRSARLPGGNTTGVVLDTFRLLDK